jgi:glucose-1-phosphate adenylyltransferase
MDNCDIGRHAKVRHTILDKNVRIPEGTSIGYDLDADRARGWHVTDSGIVVIGGEHTTVPVAALFA